MIEDTEGICQLKKDFYETEVYLHKYQPLQSYKMVHDAVTSAI